MEYNCLKLKKSLQREVHKFSSSDGLPGTCITDLCFDENGILYVGTTKGLAYYSDDKLIYVDGVRSVDKLFADSERVFVSVQNRIVVLQGGNIAGEFTYDQTVRGIAKDQADTIWMMTDNKLYRWQNETFVYINDTEFNVECISAAEPGVVYAAGKDALMILRGKRFEWGNILRGRSRMPVPTNVD